jgi:uncharacterized protein (UPF0305 family)
MFKIEYIIPVMMSYRLLFLELLKYKKEETVKNIITAINCFVFMLSHYFNRDALYITHAVIGFYIYDLIYLITSSLQYNDNNNNNNNNDKDNDKNKYNDKDNDKNKYKKKRKHTFHDSSYFINNSMV